MANLHGRKVFKVFNQDFIVDERYNVTKELGQGAYGIVWYVDNPVESKSSPRYSCRLSVLSLAEGIEHAMTDLQELTVRNLARQQTTKPAKASPSKRSPTSSARRFSRSAPCERSSSCSTSEGTGMYDLLTHINSNFGACSRSMLMDGPQITCLYDMDIPRPDNFNETYLYEGLPAQ